MKVQINKNGRISIDRRNYSLQKRCQHKTRGEQWTPKSFFSNLGQLFEGIENLLGASSTGLKTNDLMVGTFSEFKALSTRKTMKQKMYLTISIPLLWEAGPDLNKEKRVVQVTKDWQLTVISREYVLQHKAEGGKLWIAKLWAKDLSHFLDDLERLLFLEEPDLGGLQEFLEAYKRVAVEVGVILSNCQSLLGTDKRTQLSVKEKKAA